jgi:hypothetical protein
MRYFLDTEFNSFGGKLMSLALSPADPSIPPFYRVVEMTDPLDPWVAKHVSPHLNLQPEPREVVAQALAEYLSEHTKPIIVADWPSDFEHLMALLITGPGEMVGAPDFAMEFYRLHGFNTAGHSALPHNALADAEALRAHFLATVEHG